MVGRHLFVGRLFCEEMSMTFENYWPGLWRGWFQQELRIPAQFPVAEWHGGGRQHGFQSCVLSIFIQRNLPSPPPFQIQSLMQCVKWDHFSCVKSHDNMLYFAELWFPHEQNKWPSWSSAVGKGTRTLTPHRGALQTGLLWVGTVLMNSKKTLQMVPTGTDGYWFNFFSLNLILY